MSIDAFETKLSYSRFSLSLSLCLSLPQAEMTEYDSVRKMDCGNGNVNEIVHVKEEKRKNEEEEEDEGRKKRKEERMKNPNEKCN